MNIKASEGAVGGPPPQVARAKIMTEEEHREAWERGDIDYKGQDAFDNLMEKMKQTMNRKKSPSPPSFKKL
jgi:hypothetical protein